MLSKTQEEESWLRTAVKGFAKVLVFTGDRRQNGAGGCGVEIRVCKAGRVGGDGAGHLIEKLGNRVGFQSNLCMLWLRRKAGGLS